MRIAAVFCFLWSAEMLLAGGRISDLTDGGQPNVQSASSIVVDLASGSVLFEKNSDAVRPIASLSKMLAAWVINDQCRLTPDELHEMTIANREAAKGGDKTKLTTGWSYSHNDLMHAALMRSDNRALPALAEACQMTPATLADLMTKKAAKLGLKNTKFVEPNGLSVENVSTAREMITVLKEVIAVPALAAIMVKEKKLITAHRKGEQRSIEIRNTDRLVASGDAEIIGGKTGYTDIARYCLAVAFNGPDRHPIGEVFLGAEGQFTRFGDFTRVYRWLTNFVAGRKSAGQ